ncbi:SUMF1/EgtB/PvdO family nonheme iron enzyme [Pleionea sp. CnH1-48]|uniref:formylglycine-generating enzyme family protein n=1 Tax=Pleionea sp. CnH1-48 TaxID=2954494 RepID=UPI0020970393|nr:SUMF1/EgtB/PvdO family nonheme iron enzyme [Pleionea sp. CnH1-48]MCO7224354.1 formylglycine-generating enzyme family protein [Pleionea sp. CnH1-48]
MLFRKDLLLIFFVGFITNLWAGDLATHEVTSDKKIIPIEPLLLPLVNQGKDIDIYMGKYEVTVAEFIRFINATGYQVVDKCHQYSASQLPAEPKGRWDHPDLVDNYYKPVVCIGVKGAIAYANWLSKTTGKSYRLAEYKEWHFAASEGKASRFAFGEDYNQSEICEYENIEDVANLAGLIRDHNERHEQSARCNDGAIYHTVVGMYRPNLFGFHDLMGNVREFLQTCVKKQTKEPNHCIEYNVGGEAWHWQARSVHVPATIATDFNGGLEGFRLVLETNKTPPVSAATLAFSKNLSLAQKAARLIHNKNKLIPEPSSGLRAELLDNDKVELVWNPSMNQNTTYSVYRSYLDPKGKLSRKMQKIAEGLTTPRFIDQLEANGAASYQVFVHSKYGESLASNEASIGKHKIFTLGERIQAEQYRSHRHTRVGFPANNSNKKSGEQIVRFVSNIRHYPEERVPFLPAWIKFDFNSHYEGKARLKMRVKPGGDEAKLEVWQGHHLLARLSTGKESGFVELETDASLIKSDAPLEIRAANQVSFSIDWLEINS